MQTINHENEANNILHLTVDASLDPSGKTGCSFNVRELLAPASLAVCFILCREMVLLLIGRFFLALQVNSKLHEMNQFSLYGYLVDNSFNWWVGRAYEETSTIDGNCKRRWMDKFCKIYDAESRQSERGADYPALEYHDKKFGYMLFLYSF